MLPKQFQQIYHLIEHIEQHDEVAYIVGGAIRNLLLHKQINDVDLTTSASPAKIATIFPHVIDIAVEHGTVLVVHDGIPYEVTTFRGPYGTLKDDLFYRDFTMNALAMGKDGVIIDHYHGQAHIHEKMIVAVGSASDRILEDPLRILRAIRFVSELNFSLDEELSNIVNAEKQRLQHIATERLLQEWSKLIQGPYMAQAIQLVHDLHIDQYVPIMALDKSFIYALLHVEKPFIDFACFIAYMHIKHANVSVQQWVKAWKASNNTKKEAQELIRLVGYYEKNGVDDILIYEIQEKQIKAFSNIMDKLYSTHHIDVKTYANIRRNLPIQSRSELAITGHDIMKMFPTIKQGKWIRDILENIERMVILRQIPNEKNEIKEWIQCHPPVSD